MADVHDENAYEQAIRDEIFRADVAAAYSGRYSVSDALWWLAHPDEPAPSGRLAPAARLRDLQHQLFSEHGDGLNDPEAASQLPRLEAEIRYERQAIEHAVAAARAAPGDGATAYDTTEIPDAGEAAPADTLAPDSTQTHTDDGAQPLPSPMFWQRPSRSTVIGLGVAAALILGVGIGTHLGQTSADASSAAQPTASATPTPTASRIAALEIFDREQTPADIPTQFMPDTLNQDSFRLLRDAGPGDFFPLAYAVRSSSGMVCLLITPTQLDYMVTCMTDSDFPARGVRLQLMTELVFPGSTASPQPTDLSIVWATDGTIEMTGSSRPIRDVALDIALEPTLEPTE